MTPARLLPSEATFGTLVVAAITAFAGPQAAFATVFSVTSYSGLISAINSAADGDIIEFARDSSNFTYQANQELNIPKSLTFRLAAGVNSATIDMKNSYDIEIPGHAGGTVQVWNGPIHIVGSKPGSIWSNGSSQAVMRTSTDNGDVSLTLNSVSIDGNNKPDRCIQSASTSVNHMSFVTLNDCSFFDTLDDNANALCEPEDGNERARVVANNCTFTNSRFGLGLTAHNFARSIATNCTFSGHQLGPISSGANGRVEAYFCTATCPPIVANGGTFNGRPVPFMSAMCNDSSGSVDVFEDCTFTNLWSSGGHDRLLISVVADATGASATFRRCNFAQQKNGGLIVVNAGSSLMLEDCTFTITGDPRRSTQNSPTTTTPYAGVEAVGNVTIIRSVFNYQPATSRGGTNTPPMLRASSGAALNVEGCVLIRHNLGGVSCNGADFLAGSAGSLRHCTFFATNDPGNGAAISTDGIDIVACIFEDWNAGLNIIAGSYSAGSGYNVFHGNNIVVAGGSAKATDSPASNQAASQVAPGFINSTYGSLNLRLANTTGPCQLRDTSGSAAYVMESYALALSAGPGGAASRYPTREQAWPTPLDSGAYTNPAAVVTATAEPDNGYGFSSWTGSVSGTGNPLQIVMNANKSATANFSAAGCMPCDTNCDGSVNPFDVNNFAGMFDDPPLAPCSPCAGDANRDGTTNPFDINAFLACMNP